MSRAHTTGEAIERLHESLSARDIALLDQLRDLKLMSGAQIQTVHFPLSEHATHDAAGRACRRVLRRLSSNGLVVRLERRVGGVRGGSAGFIYGLAPIGHRLLDGDGPRRRFREPSATFVRHTLTISDLVVSLISRQRSKQIELLRLQPEPRCWRSFSSVAGLQSLRPDLFVALSSGELEHHWFVEVDLGTETMGRRITKCKHYESYYRTGIEQDAHEVFPKVLWIVPGTHLHDQLHQSISRAKALTGELFEVVTQGDAVERLCGGTQ